MVLSDSNQDLDSGTRRNQRANPAYVLLVQTAQARANLAETIALARRSRLR